MANITTLTGFEVNDRRPRHLRSVAVDQKDVPYVVTPESNSLGAITFTLEPAKMSLDPDDPSDSTKNIFTPITNWVAGDLPATVDPRSGDITLHKAGYVIITVHQEAYGDFAAASATQNLTIVKAGANRNAYLTISDVGICARRINAIDGLACTMGTRGRYMDNRKCDANGNLLQNNFNVSWEIVHFEPETASILTQKEDLYALDFWIDNTIVVRMCRRPANGNRGNIEIGIDAAGYGISTAGNWIAGAVASVWNCLTGKDLPTSHGR